MATWSTNLGLTLIGTGEQAGTWGDTTNTNLGTLIEQAISGYVTQAITDGADTVITIPNGATGVARNMYIEATGALTAARNLVVPANKKLYFVYNNTTGGFAITVKVAGHTGVVVNNGIRMSLVCNGTDVVQAITLPAASGFVTGPAGATANALARYDGVTGSLIKNSSASLSDAGLLTATSFSGIGTLLTALNASNLNSGTLPDARLAATVAKYADATANFTGTLQYGGIEVGYRKVPRVAVAGGTAAVTEVGKCYSTTAGMTIPNSTFVGGDAISIFNNTAGSITLTQGAGLTLYFGTATGNRTLAARCMATIWFDTTSVAAISGSGLT